MASTRERNGRFIGLYRDGDGKQKSAGTYATKKEALRAARGAEAGVAPVKTEVAYPKKVRGKTTVASYAYEWLALHALSAHARYVYEQMLRKHIIPALGGLVLTDVTAADIRGYFRSLETAGTSQALGKKIKTVLSAMFQAAAEDRLCPVNPVRGVKFQAAPPKRRRALTADQWRAVRKYLTGEYRLLADIQMATGARIEEIMAMETTDITDGVWHVQRVRNQVDGQFSTRDMTKTKKDRWTLIGPELAEQIKAAGPGRVFSDFRLDTYRQCVWYPACKAAGLDLASRPA